MRSSGSLPLAREAWERVEAIFAQVLELPPAQRTPFLGAACSADGALRREVESLLAAHGCAGALEHLGSQLSPEVDAALADLRTIEVHVEGYRLLSRLGAGGMGEVFLAEREGDGYRQRVALKVLHHAGPDSSLIPRFLAERRILASLEHCGIPRFLDGGLTRDGAPYLSMELVDGLPIDAYCATHRLSTADRLGLFAALCDAIHYAHQHLVVHRDLKPSNVLVPAAGAVKVLDFGIAKILTPQPGVEVSPETRPWMTLPYASPEQVRGEAITTAVDVYALGVLLFELLAGRRPFEAPNVRALQDAILEQDPPGLASMVTRELASARGVTQRRYRSPGKECLWHSAGSRR